MCIVLMKVNAEINKQVNSAISRIRNTPQLIKQLLRNTFNHIIKLISGKTSREGFDLYYYNSLHQNIVTLICIRGKKLN